MIDEDNYIIKERIRKDNGRVDRSKLFRHKCSKCHVDIGYKRKRVKNRVCKSCLYPESGKQQPNMPNRSLNCPMCKVSFSTKQYNKKFCSDKCKKKNTRDKRRSTKQGKLKHRVSSLLSTRLRLQGLNKNNKSTFDVLPYTLEELMTHLESQFESWMSWDNYGLKGWTIDHIVAESRFSYLSTEDEEFKRCWSLSNLKPMRHYGPNGNASKGDKL